MGLPDFSDSPSPKLREVQVTLSKPCVKEKSVGPSKKYERFFHNIHLSFCYNSLGG